MVKFETEILDLLDLSESSLRLTFAKQQQSLE